MKNLVLAAIAISFGTAHAQDATQEKTRYATMEATYASGFYQPTRAGALALTYAEDGSPYSLTLSVQGRKLTARVWQADASPCGDRIYARLNIPDDNMITDLVLTDYSNVRCRLYVKHKWHAAVGTREANGSESRLELEGDPNP